MHPLLNLLRQPKILFMASRCPCLGVCENLLGMFTAQAMSNLPKVMIQFAHPISDLNLEWSAGSKKGELSNSGCNASCMGLLKVEKGLPHDSSRHLIEFSMHVLAELAVFTPSFNQCDDKWCFGSSLSTSNVFLGWSMV